jgi:hypothetical protein
MQRGMVIFLMTVLVLIGALHFSPLWIFVVVLPLWLPHWFKAEEQRIHDDAIEQVRSRLHRRTREDE